MKALFALAIALFAIQIQAAITDGTYSCAITPRGSDRPEVTLGFRVNGGEIQCQKGEGDDCEAWFTYAPEEQTKFWLDGLYDGGYEHDSEGNFRLRADSDGCNLGSLVLYQNARYLRGFITSEFHCSSTETTRFAGSVSCTRE